MRILVLVIVSFDKPVYYDMLQVWRERVCSRSDVWFIQCKPASEWIGDVINDLSELRSLRAPLCLRPDGCKNPPFLESHLIKDNFDSQSHSLKDRFELDIENKTLYVRGDECLIPGILHKTVEALSFFLREDQYDYVWRTNLSSVLDFAGLERFLLSLNQPNGLYAGYIGKALLGDHNLYLKGGGLTCQALRPLGEPSSPTFFASGAGFLMSCDVAMYLVENKEFLRWDIIDDVAIGALLEPQFGLKHLERCWVQSEHIVAEKDVFHFRCESYQHLRTVEFMRLASQQIASRG